MISNVLFQVMCLFGSAIFFGALFAIAHDNAQLTAILVVVVFALLAFQAIGFVVTYVYWRYYIKTYFYSADEHFITIRKGVFAPTEIHVQYSKIQDVYVDQDITDRVMGLYDVHIASATYASGIEAHIDGVDAVTAEGLKQFFLNRITNASRPSAPSAPAVSEVSTSATPEVTLPADVTGVSSVSFPINGKWYAQSVLSALFGSALISVLITVRAEIPVLFSLIPFVILFVGQFLYAVLWKNAYTWNLSSEFLEMSEGVIARKSTHLPYRTIQDVILTQSIIERVLGLCTVRVENAASVSMSSSKKASSRGIRFPGQPHQKGKELVEVFRRIRTSGHASTGL